MKRDKFLKSSLTLAGAMAFLTQCSKDEAGNEISCETSPIEIEGPFPTKSPASVQRKDITAGSPGAKIAIDITVRNSRANCNVLADAIVDIWHCNHEGNYSEYGDEFFQKADYKALHFLRGRQRTDQNGVASFTSIYPGWYPGRAPHIHVHIYDKLGTTLLITQIAFPDTISADVFKTGVYASHGQADTLNATDFIFRDTPDMKGELAKITGDDKNGYTLTHTINVIAV